MTGFRLAFPGIHDAGSRRSVAVSALALLLAVAAAAPADAQSPQQQRRPRGYRGLFGGGPPPDPNRTRQDLTLTASLLAGYDDNLAAAALGGGGTPTGTTASDGYLGQGQVDLRYYRGRLVRSFTLEGSAYAVGYGDVGVGTVQGGLLNVSGTTRVRTRDNFQVSQRLSYDPLFTLGSLSVLDPIATPGTLPGSNTTTGLTERRSWSSQSGLDYSWAASRRSTVNMSYGFAARRYPEAEDVPGDSNTHRASLGMTRTMNRTFSLQSAYDYSYGRYNDADGVRPLTEHSISAGPQIEKVFSRTRRLQLSAGLGAQYVRTLSSVALRRTMVDYWTPFGEAAAQYDVSRTWDLTVNYRRGTTVLPEVTTESFVTDAVSIGAGGAIGSRLEVEGNAGLSTGTTASAAGGRARNQTLTWTSQARWAFSRSVAATVNYDYYEYEFTNVGDLPEGFSPATGRNTIRVGVTFFLPLVGNYPAERSGGRSSRP